MKTKSLLAAILLVATLTQCKKATYDWAADVEGHYIDASDGSEVVVVRRDDTHVSIHIAAGNDLMYFLDVTMHDASTFTLNTFAPPQDWNCYGTLVFTGNGSFTSTNVSLFIHQAGTGNGGPEDCITTDHQFFAIKQ